MAHVRDASRLCETVHEQRVLRIVFSLFLLSTVTARAVLLLFEVIGVSFLRASSTSEFSHKPGVRERKHNLLPFPTSACRLRSGIALSSSLNCSPAPSRETSRASRRQLT